MITPPLDNLRDPAWGLPPIPDKFGALRPLQIDALQQILTHFESGCDVVALDAPTGLGKTLLADVLSRVLRVPIIYLCNTRTLQEQFQKDFGIEFGGYSYYIQGRSNYPTEKYPDRQHPEDTNHPDRLTCEDCTAEPPDKDCSWCTVQKIELENGEGYRSIYPRCPYRMAKRAAQASRLVCANLQYFLRECRGPGMFSGRPLVIADEADQIESILMSDVQVEISRTRLWNWGIDPLKPGSAPWEAEKWVKEIIIPRVVDDLDALAKKIDRRGEKNAVKMRRAYKALARLLEALDDQVIQGLWSQTWVAVDDEGGTTFKPVLVEQFGQGRLWRHGVRWMLMSATMLDPVRLVKDIGGAERTLGVVKMPSSFPAKNRPVILASVVSVNKEMTDSGVAPRYLGEAIRRIADAHPTERMLVHTVSYALMRLIRKHFNDPRALWIERSEERDDQLSRFLDRPNSMLFGPAMERGLDLPDDACRVIIICKLPFLYLGDAQIAARKRLADGGEWYVNQMLRSLVQMTGRGVRHQDDWCKTYILDRSIEWLLDRDGHRLPEWWREALARP